MKVRLDRLLTLVCLLASSSFAAPTAVTSGSVMMHFDPVALAGLNYGYDPYIGALILEEFFEGNADRARTYNQILTDQIVPNFTPIPTTNLRLEINGPTVSNPAGRNFAPSTFVYDTATGTVNGEIGLTGTMRFIGDFVGAFVLGDFDMRYNLSPFDYDYPYRGWVFVNNYGFVGVPAFETANVVGTVSGGKLVITGDLTVSYELDLYFFPGDWGRRIGSFRLETPNALALPPRTPTLAKISPGAFQIDVIGKGNVFYQLQYSTNLINWTNAGPRVTGTEQLIRWNDTGPPLTPVVPSGSRFYRLIEY